MDEKILETGEAFAVNQVLRWADQLLDALEYMHGHQPPVVHRDIKPQNLKLTEQGDVILPDFGLAKGVASEMSQTDESVLKSLPGFTCTMRARRWSRSWVREPIRAVIFTRWPQPSTA